jgi:hypothetical protein
VRIRRASKKVRAAIVACGVAVVAKYSSLGKWLDPQVIPFSSKRANLVFNSPWRKLAIKAWLGFHGAADRRSPLGPGIIFREALARARQCSFAKCGSFFSMALPTADCVVEKAPGSSYRWIERVNSRQRTSHQHASRVFCTILMSAPPSTKSTTKSSPPPGSCRTTLNLPIKQRFHRHIRTPSTCEP